MRTNLTAKTDNEKIILEYIEQNATDYLCTKINNSKKTLQGCWSYITAEAKKQAVNGCACIEDATVYGWAIHFFEEDSVTEASPLKKEEVKKEQKKVESKPKEDTTQVSLFDLMG